MEHPALKEALKLMLLKYHCCWNCIEFGDFLFLKSSLSPSDASQTFKEHGPAACQVITTSLPSLLQDTIIGCQGYQLEPGSTFPNFVQDVCSNSRRLFSRSHSLSNSLSLSHSLSQLDRWELYCVLVICRQREREREQDRQYSPSRAISDWQACLHLSLSRISIWWNL